MTFLKIKNLKKALFVLVATGTLSAQAFEASAKIQKFELKNCNLKGVCVQLQANQAESGNFTPVMSLSDVHINLVHRNHTKHYEARFGYIDLEHQIVVIRLNATKEVSVNLSDLSVKEFRL